MGLQFYVIEWGDLQDFFLLFLYGICGYGEIFVDLVQCLLFGYCCIVLDQCGCGQSDWDLGCNYYIDIYVVDMEVLVVCLGLCQFDLLGYFMGGINVIVYVVWYLVQVCCFVIEDVGFGVFENSFGVSCIC